MFLCDNHWKFWTISNYNFETNFLKNEILFIWKLEYCFLVEFTLIKNATIPYKTALLEGNVKVIRTGSTKWTFQKNKVLPVTTLFFWKFCFIIRTFYKELIWCIMFIFILFVSAGVLFEGVFSLWLSSTINISLNIDGTREKSIWEDLFW